MDDHRTQPRRPAVPVALQLTSAQRSFALRLPSALRLRSALLLTAVLSVSALLGLASPAKAAVAGSGASEAPRLVFTGEPATEGDVARLREIDPARLTGALLLAGLDEPGGPIRVAVLPESSAVARRTPGWVAGFADGHDSSVVLFPARAGHYPHDSLEELLQHEVAHVYVDRAAANQPVPRWLHEGIAMTAGDRWGLEDRSRFAVEVAMGGRVPLASLDALFRGGEPRRAYAVAGGFVNHLLRRHGPQVTGDILHGLSEGRSVEAAFEDATGESLAAAEASFWKRQTFWSRWLPLLTSSTVLWTGVALLALVAWRRRQQRAAELMERWEEEDAPPPPPPRWSPHGDRRGGDDPPRRPRRREWVH